MSSRVRFRDPRLAQNLRVHAYRSLTRHGGQKSMKAVISAGLSGLATPIENLTLDPNNARRGDIPAIRRSLNVFGQRKPIVARRLGKDASGRPTGMIIAGNHTLQAAIELEWDHIAVNFVDDDEVTSKAYALTDNRTAELATWDDMQLADTLRELSGDDQFQHIEALGWTEDDLAKLLNGGKAVDAPEDFPTYDENIDTEHTCPSCGYQFSGGS